MGDGYEPEEHGHVIVVQGGDDITQIEEIEPNRFFVDDIPNFELVEAFVDGDRVVFEIVVAQPSRKHVNCSASKENL